jgi:hypothetical protein
MPGLIAGAVGLQAGYNYVLPNRFLIGAEVDASLPSFQNLAGIFIGGISAFTSRDANAPSRPKRLIGLDGYPVN